LQQVSLVDFLVRAAVKEDFPAIRGLIREVHINPTGLDWRRFLVAVTTQNSLLGCGQIKFHFDGSRELASIAVQKKVRGQGVARSILQELLAHEAARPLYLMCRARLVTLYVKFGFQTIPQYDMPLYFQLIKRAERIFNFAAQPEDRLAIMRLG
jgi:N-acetylglutamate synthase-like GNAT family acetyltransferase